MSVISGIDRMRRLTLTVLAFSGFYLGSALLSWILLPVVCSGRRSALGRAVRAQRIARRGLVLFHDCMRISGVLLFEPGEVAGKLPQCPCVVIANHPTLIDVTALMVTLGAPTACVVKSSLLKSLSVGRLLRYCWHINSGPGKLIGNGAVVDQALQRMAAGMCVLIFPEGTRSPEGGLRRFRRGAFEIATRAKVPVVPFFVRCEPPVLAKMAPWHRVPEKVPRLTIMRLPTLDPADWGANSAAMAADVQALYRRLVRGEAPLSVFSEERMEAVSCN